MCFSYRRLVALVGVVAFVGAATSVQAQFSGAIYTSNADGTTVNGNIYDDCNDVYLNGGPQNQNANGLPPGVYYFQVTTPNGATLL